MPGNHGNGVTFRPITSDDLGFLQELYGSTRAEELAMTDWSEDQKNAFVSMQFGAQHTYYQERFPNARFEMILLDDESVGRLYVDRTDDEIRIIDIALVPRSRNKGLGRSLMEDFLSEGTRDGKKVTIHVEKNNPALSFYDRLGFVRKGDVGVYWYMEWHPEGPSGD